MEDPGPWFTHTHLILEMMGLNVVFVMVRWVTLDPGKTRGHLNRDPDCMGHFGRMLAAKLIQNLKIIKSP